MTLAEWIEKERGETSRWAFCQDLSARLEELGTPISAQTIANVANGMRLNKYNLAKALSDITRGTVTVEELCE